MVDASKSLMAKGVDMVDEPSDCLLEQANRVADAEISGKSDDSGFNGVISTARRGAALVCAESCVRSNPYYSMPRAGILHHQRPLLTRRLVCLAKRAPCMAWCSERPSRR